MGGGLGVVHFDVLLDVLLRFVVVLGVVVDIEVDVVFKQVDAVDSML